MGQQQSKQPVSARQYRTRPQQAKRQIQHEGVLKLRSTPFPSCVEIDSNGLPLFLENAQTTLEDLLQNRFYTNRLFMKQDIQRLLESVVYTLAHFEEMEVPYKQLSAHNIYYCNGLFKLLPNELIDSTIYDKAYSNLYEFHQKQTQVQEFALISPEMVVALRYKQKQITDLQILSKSNVFILGLIFLQACTMLPSRECFDPQSYDIFNNIVTERLEMAQEHYDGRIARIIGNMVDYDYSQRIKMKDLAIWINRQFAIPQQCIDDTEYCSHEKIGAVEAKSRVISHSIENIEQEPQSNKYLNESLATKSYGKSNSVYIKGYNQFDEQVGNKEMIYSKGNKNSVYLNYPSSKMEGSSNQYQLKTNNQIKQQELQERIYKDHQIQIEKQNSKSSLSGNSHQPAHYFEQRGKYDYRILNNRTNIKSSYAEATNKIEKGISSHYQDPEIKKYCERTMKDRNPYLNTMKDNEENIYIPNNETTKRLNLHSQVGSNRENKSQYDSRQSQSNKINKDGSINRIKMQIQKSRQLIEQFRKCQGLGNY